MIGAILALLGCGSGPDPEVGESRILEDRRYRFCHEVGADAELARRWCPLLEGEDVEVCPAVRAACDDPELASTAGCGVRPLSRAQPEEEVLPEGCAPGAAPTAGGRTAGQVLKWITALAVAASVLVFLRLVSRGFGAPARGPARPSAEPDAEQEPLPEVPDLPVADLLSAARTALRGGRAGEAVGLARGAVLRRLGEAGRIRLHRASTDREYLRTLRGDPTHPDVVEVLGAAERHRWEGRTPEVDAADRVIDAAARVIGALAAGAALVLAAPAHASRYGPAGDVGLYQVLDARGYEVRWRSAPLAALDDGTDVVVIDLSVVSVDEEGWDGVRTWVSGGGVAWIAGDPEGSLPELGDWLRVGSPVGTRVAGRLEGLLPVPRWPGGAEAVWDADAGAWIWGETDGLEAIDAGTLTGPRPVIREVVVGSGRVLAIADPRILRNGSLIRADNEAFLGDLLEVARGPLGWPLPTPIRIDLATQASGAADPPSGSQVSPRLIPFALQLLAWWVLAGAWLGWPFGPVRPEDPGGRAQFSAHVRALGGRLARTGASGYALHLVSRYWLGKLGPARLIGAVEATGRSREEAAALVRRCEVAAADPDAPPSEGDLEVIEALGRLTR